MLFPKERYAMHTIQMHLKDPSKYFCFSSRLKIAFRLKLFGRFKINELIDFIEFDRLCQNIFSKFFIAKFIKTSVIMNII
jgi:hypothetical protein